VGEKDQSGNETLCGKARFIVHGEKSTNSPYHDGVSAKRRSVRAVTDFSNSGTVPPDETIPNRAAGIKRFMSDRKRVHRLMHEVVDEREKFV
jgi:hypothetical protein